MTRFDFVSRRLLKTPSTLFLLGAAVLALALFSGAIEPGQVRADPAHPGWGQKATKTASSLQPSSSGSCPATPDFSFTVSDPTGDAFGFGPVRHDITAVSGEGDSTTFCLTVEFAGPVDPADAGTPQSLVGFIDFDTDENAATGFPSAIDRFCPTPAGIGVEAELDMFSVFGGIATMFPGGQSVPITFSGTGFTAAIPMSAIGGDSSFNFAMVLGTFAEPTDCAPNGGSIHSPDGSVIPFVPLNIALSIDPNGSVVASTGSVTISGTLTCSKPAFAVLSGDLRQKAGRVIILGHFFNQLECEGATPWVATVVGDNGIFKAGNANASVSAFASTNVEFVSAQTSATVRLTGSRPVSPTISPPASPPGKVLAGLGGSGGIAVTAALASGAMASAVLGFGRLLRTGKREELPGPEV